MGDREDKNINNFFLNPEELGKLVNTLKNSFGNSVREVVGMINNENVHDRKIIPTKDKRIVVQNPREIKDSKSKAASTKVMSFGAFVIGAIVAFEGIMDVDLETVVVGAAFFAGAFFLMKEHKKQKVISTIMERYNKYLRAFGNGTICNLKELAIFANVDEDTVLKDLSYYIQKDYLKETRIVDGAVILNNQTYEEYRRIPKPEEKIEKLVDNNYLNKLLNYHNSIDEPVKSDVKELLLIVEKIYSNAKENPQEMEKFEKFKEYYLPSVVKLLGEYEKIQSLDVNSPKILELKKDIESSIKIINEAFKNLLEDMYEGSVIDIKTDISVLKTMLHQEGLLDRI